MQPFEDRSYFIGDVRLISGGTLRDACLQYRTYGKLNKTADNCVLIPTYYTGSHRSYELVIGNGKALDPQRFFIVIVDMFGNGESTSPSHLTAGAARAAFPKIDVQDNVRCQHWLLTQILRVKQIRLAMGWSLGAIQACHWAEMYPAMVKNLLSICGATRCWPINAMFLDGLKAAMLADPHYDEGAYLIEPIKGIAAFSRVYAGWAYSSAYFRNALYRAKGSQHLEDVLQAWERDHLLWDASDLMAMRDTWRSADIAKLPGCENDLGRALRRLEARSILMPCVQDAYFTLEENEIEAKLIPHAELRVIDSPYGHSAGAPGRFPDETLLIEQAVRDLLVD